MTSRVGRFFWWGSMRRTGISSIRSPGAGNCRTLMTLAEEILDYGVREEAPKLDEKLYFEVFEPEETAKKRGRRRSRG